MATYKQKAQLVEIPIIDAKLGDHIFTDFALCDVFALQLDWFARECALPENFKFFFNILILPFKAGKIEGNSAGLKWKYSIVDFH